MNHASVRNRSVITVVLSPETCRDVAALRQVTGLSSPEWVCSSYQKLIVPSSPDVTHNAR